MAEILGNRFCYEDQMLPNDERLSTNGHYTGEHLGSVTQDAKCEMTAHMIENSTIRYGTITQDAIPRSTPDVVECLTPSDQ